MIRMPTNASEWKLWGTRAIRSLQLGCAVYFFTTHVLGFGYNYGVSMHPTLKEWGDILLIRYCSRANPLSFIERGDIVTAVSPNTPRRPISKRLIGLPGDIVWVDPTGESGVASSEWIKVPKGHVWLAGDNPSNSIDSRYYGPVSLNLLRGKIVARIRPRPKIWRNDMERQSIDG